MTSTSFEYAAPENYVDFFHTLTQAALKHQPIEAIYAFAEQYGPHVLALPEDDDNPAQPPPSPGECRAVARAYISSIPRPELRFASRKEAAPEPGEPCDCGSGQTFEKCCGAFLERTGVFILPNPLMHLLPLLPQRQWPDLAHSAIDVDMVAFMARILLQSHEPQTALTLLAPWLEGKKKPIPAAHAELLNALIDAYDALDQPRKKRQLLDNALKRGDHVIRGDAHQRLAALAADLGNYEKAWQHFEDAERENPEDSALSNLEVLLLLQQGDEEDARARAQYWLEHLQPKDTPEDSLRMTFLRNVVERGEAAMADFIDADGLSEEALEHLTDLFYEDAPDEGACYSLPHATADHAGQLVPQPELAEALRHWQEAFPQVQAALTMSGVTDHPAFSAPDDWLDALEEFPGLWNSLEVLDDLVLALDSEFDTDDHAGSDTHLEYRELRERLLDRAQRLLTLNLQVNGAEGKTLEWGFHGNRPALRLIAQRIHGDSSVPASDETLACIEWMLALNPTDNHGMREQAMQIYLQRQQFDKALALSERYPGDGNIDMQFGTVLALFATGQQEAAAAALAKAHEFVPKVAPMLLADNPLRPKNDASTGFISHGSEYQAWDYRRNCLALWRQQPGVLEWLKTRIE